MKPIIYYLNGRKVEIPAEYEGLVTSKYRKEIAAEYGLSEVVFRRRIKKLNIDTGPRGYMDESHVLEIYLAMGWPCVKKNPDY
jgi:hypothetical protein